MTINNKMIIMKKVKFLLLPMVMIMTIGCTKFFDVAPQGVASPALLKSKAGVNALLVGAYSLLDGVGAVQHNGMVPLITGCMVELPLMMP
jgi:hypothetical protein